SAAASPRRLAMLFLRILIPALSLCPRRSHSLASHSSMYCLFSCKSPLVCSHELPRGFVLTGASSAVVLDGMLNILRYRFSCQPFVIADVHFKYAALYFFSGVAKIGA